MAHKSSSRVQSSSLKRNSNRFIILWGASEKEIPPRPVNPASFPMDNSNYWFDMEYAGWNIVKTNIPDSPRTGAEGKRIVYLQPGGGFQYMDQYASTLQRISLKSNIDLSILDASWNNDLFKENVQKAIESKPDMILLNPENHQECTSWYRIINEAGIPVIGGNFLADQESHRYLLAWTGPDDWGQSRLLARHLANRMGKSGGYAILQHIEGNSSYYARTWGVVTELKKHAPAMSFLDAKPGMDKAEAAENVRNWIKQYGADLKGLFCADDNETMCSVAEVLKDTGREDIICVAAGSSKNGLELILQDRLLATAYQSPVIDGEIAMQTIIDWFEGVPIEAIRYLPKHIITKSDAAEFLNIEPQVESLDLENLFRKIHDFDWQGSYTFFGDLYLRFLKNRVLPIEHFQGLCLEILTGIIHIIKTYGLSVEDCLGSYDGMVKHLFKDDDVSSLLDWLNQLTQHAISGIMEKLNRRTPIQEIIEYIELNISRPISLKTLSFQFNISHAYLGQMFKKETGIKFNDYINTLKIEKAKKMLRGKGIIINDIARELGFTNPDYFYKVFKKHTGLSAGEYMSKKQ